MPVTTLPEHPDHGGLMTGPVSRRRVLQLTAASVLGITLGACSGADDDQATEQQPPEFWLAIADAARAQHPELTRRAAEAELHAIGGAAQVRHLAAAHRRVVRQRIADDFADGHTMLVSGWLLSRTEVAAAIVAAGSRP